MRKFMSYLKLPIFFCALALLPGAHPCFAQTSGQASGQQASAADQQIPPAVAKKLEAMEARIEQLEAELKARPVVAPLSAKASAPMPSSTAVSTSSSISAATSAPVAAQAQSEPTAAQTPAARARQNRAVFGCGLDLVKRQSPHQGYILGHEIFYAGDQN